MLVLEHRRREEARGGGSNKRRIQLLFPRNFEDVARSNEGKAIGVAWE